MLLPLAYIFNDILSIFELSIRFLEYFSSGSEAARGEYLYMPRVHRFEYGKNPAQFRIFFFPRPFKINLSAGLSKFTRNISIFHNFSIF